MMIKFSKKAFLFFTLIFVFVQGVFAQYYYDDDDDIEWLEPNSDEFTEDDYSHVKQSDDLIYPFDVYERNSSFVMVEPVHEHELNPQLTSYASDSQLLTGLYEGLFSYDPISLEPVYAIATSHRISRDKLRWTFTIRENAYFSNGEQITAQNVRDSWIQLLSTPEAPYASLLDVIKGAYEFRNGKISDSEVGIYATSPTSLTVHLVKPASYLPKVLCHSAFSVIHRSPTVYSGPFVLEDYDSSGYELKKNPYYWDNEHVKLNEIIIVQSDDDEENAYYYNTGLADWVCASVNTSKILDRESYHLNAEFATSFFFFRDDGKKIWSKPEFRNALFEAFPWEEFQGKYYVKAATLVYPLKGYPEVEGFSYTDISEAKNLMKLAREKYRIPENKKLQLTLEISENSFSDEQLALISDAWAELGVELNIRRIPSYAYFSNIPHSDADIFNYVWIGDFADPLAFLELFRGDSSLNDSHWKNDEFDSLLDRAAAENSEERYKLLSQAEIILLDSFMVIPIQHPVTYNIIDLDEVGGWSTNAFDIHPLKYLYKNNPAVKTQNVVVR